MVWYFKIVKWEKYAAEHSAGFRKGQSKAWHFKIKGSISVHVWGMHCKYVLRPQVFLLHSVIMKSRTVKMPKKLWIWEKLSHKLHEHFLLIKSMLEENGTNNLEMIYCKIVWFKYMKWYFLKCYLEERIDFFCG